MSTDSPGPAPLPLPRSSAVISSCGRYRYWLERRWSASLPLTFVMLNPSTADATIDDPTIRRCAGFARREGAGGIVVVNLYAFRATNPRDLASAADPVGTECDAHLDVAGACGCPGAPIIAAWGATKVGRAPYREHDERVAGVLARLRGFGPVHCLGSTASGAPRHPLYLPGDAPLTVLP